MKKRATAEQPPLGIPAWAREHHLTRSCRQDRRKVAPACGRDRQRIELGRGDQMVREEAVFCDLLRPAPGAQSQKTDERTGTGGQHGGGHPGYRDTCLSAVIELQALETPVESAGRSLNQGPTPEAKRRSTQDLLARCGGPFGS